MGGKREVKEFATMPAVFHGSLAEADRFRQDAGTGAGGRANQGVRRQSEAGFLKPAQWVAMNYAGMKK